MAERRRQVSPAVMLALVVAPFVLLVAAEVAAIILVAAQIGWWTLAIMALTSLLGFVLFAHESRRNLVKLQDAMALGKEPGAQVGNAMLIFLGAILLILPGFVTDAVGLLFILPFTRPLMRRTFTWWLTKTGRTTVTRDPNTIPGEVVDEDEGHEDDDGTLPLEGTVIDVDDERRGPAAD
ncbi:MAG: FxsA family protein [Propionibacterium sp.]|nr:FxsA family protein [Propionibacterium sp.]